MIHRTRRTWRTVSSSGRRHSSSSSSSLGGSAADSPALSGYRCFKVPGSTRDASTNESTSHGGLAARLVVPESPVCRR